MANVHLQLEVVDHDIERVLLLVETQNVLIEVKHELEPAALLLDDQDLLIVMI